jgi:hypothetical protein
MNIALMTYNDYNFAELASYTAPTKAKYCEKWGFSFEHLNSNARDPFWSKPTFFLNCLERYDAVIYVESDAVIINQDFDIRPYIEKHELILTHDINGINAGTYIAKSTNLVKQFFHAVKSHGPLFFNHHPWKDQEAMRYFLQTYPYHEIATWMPQNFMNSNIHEIYNYPSYVAGNYKEGDWIVHMSGMSHENRMRVLKDKFKLTQGELFPLNPNMFESKVVNRKNELSMLNILPLKPNNFFVSKEDVLGYEGK